MDGDLTDDIVTEGSVDTSKEGTYELKYKVCDKSGNFAQTTRIVHVEDWKAPVITLSGSAIIFLNKGDAYIDPGVTAFDNVDEDVTNLVSAYGTDFNTQDAGVHYIDYEVKDTKGNKSFLSRMIAVSDTHFTDGPLILYVWI